MTSERKINLFSDFTPHTEVTTQTCQQTQYTLVHNSVWDIIMQGLLCGECGKNSICVDMEENHGFATKLVVKCRECGFVSARVYSSPRMESKESQRPPFQVNKDMVEAFVEIGKGQSAMEKFSMCMGMSTHIQGCYITW